jgi:hypothetical protein
MMVIPSGLRSSEPVPLSSASGSAPNSAASVVIMIGRKRNSAACTIDSSGLRPRWRSAPIAKSIIRMAFFFTMPIRSTMPISAITDRSWPNSISARSAPTPAEGRVDSIVSGWMKLSYSTPSTM